jgi:hypothetical protein
MVRKWVRKFNEGRDKMHDELWSSRPSAVSDDMMHVVEAKVCEDRRFTIPLLSLCFQQISRTVLYETVTVRLDFRKLCSRRVPKMLSEEQKEAGCQCIDLSHVIQRARFLSQIVTGDETWVSRLTLEAAVYGVEANLTAEKYKFKQTISTRKITYSFLG